MRAFLQPKDILMRLTSLSSILLSAFCTFSAAAAAAQAVPYPATLAGHAVLPALSLVPAPADAPDDLKLSGKFTTGQRVEAIGSVEGLSKLRPTGIAIPFDGQPVQGHSGIKHMPDGSFWILTDNGFGSKANSPDTMLMLNHYQVDFKGGGFERLATVFLHDPDKKVPFRILHEGTSQRYLTGSDFDPESFQFAGGALWIGEEFGPFLIKADLQGKVLAVFDTLVDGKAIRSPDHPLVVAPAKPGDALKVEVTRSKGFEGMAASPDGSKLYALLEGPLPLSAGKVEELDGKAYLRVLEFDVAKEEWTGRHWKYQLEEGGHAIGDFNMISDTTGLVIERDNGEGTADKACAAGQKPVDCFPDLPGFKRVYKVELSDANVGAAVRKIGYIDLLEIADPSKLARKPLNGEGALELPFFTIENVDIVDEKHIVVGNDNNLPFSSSREPNTADDNELVLLEVGQFLNAK